LAVYIDTWVICLATAFMIIITGMFNVQPKGQEEIVSNIPGVEAGAVNVQLVVDSVLPGFGYTFLAVALFSFVSLLCCRTTISQKQA
jgi:AGCS family alanine or glycine:cation symporter